LRYDRMAYDKVVANDQTESQWSPRVGLSYAADSKTNLRFSYGKMIQFVYTQAIERQYADPESGWAALYYGAGTGNLLPERCTQYDIGWERQVSSNFSVQVTPFYRKYTDMLQTILLDPANPDISPMVYDNVGVGTSKGIEFLAKKRMSNKLSGWLSYTYSTVKADASSDRDMISPGTMTYVDWDQRHTAAMVLNYNQKDWNYSLMGEYGSGLPWSLETDETLNTRRVSSHTVLSLNITREVKGGWLPTGQLRFGVANILNSGKALDRDGKGLATVRVPPRFINLSYVRRW
jgi:outer membrane receptor protein involved in Fe transport